MSKLDRRVSRTLEALGTALVFLACEHSYDQVSIKDITGYANVGYSTFFRHFRSKDDLLLHVMRAATIDLIKARDREDSSYDKALAMFKHIRRHRSVYWLCHQLPRTHPVTKQVKAFYVSLYHVRYRAREGSPVPIEVSVNHLVNTTIEVVSWYLDHDQEYSVEQMASIYCALVSKAHVVIADDAPSDVNCIASIDPNADDETEQSRPQ